MRDTVSVELHSHCNHLILHTNNNKKREKSGFEIKTVNVLPGGCSGWNGVGDGWWGVDFVKGPKTRWTSAQLHLSTEYLMSQPSELWMMLVENNTVLNNSTGAAKTVFRGGCALTTTNRLLLHGWKKALRADGSGRFHGSEPGRLHRGRVLQNRPGLLKIDVREALLQFLFSSHKQEGQKWIGIKSIKAASVMKPGTEMGNWQAARESSE